MKSKCCGADAINEGTFCTKCWEDCDLAPALRDSSEVLEFISNRITEWQRVIDECKTKDSIFYKTACDCMIEAEEIKNFIERIT